MKPTQDSWVPEGFKKQHRSLYGKSGLVRGYDSLSDADGWHDVDKTKLEGNGCADRPQQTMSEWRVVPCTGA